MLIKVLYGILVISTVVILGVAAALYIRVRKHMADPAEHTPEQETPLGPQ